MKRLLITTFYLASLCYFAVAQSPEQIHSIPVPDWADQNVDSKLWNKRLLDVNILLDENYPFGKIGEIIKTSPDGVADLLNKKFEIKANVYSDNLLGNRLSCYVVDKDSNGVFVESDLLQLPTPLKIGEELMIRGLVTQNNGRISFVADSLWRTGFKSTLIAPKVVKNLDETTESKLVKLEKVKLQDPNQWKAMSLVPYFVTVFNGSQYFEVLFLPYSDINQLPAPFGTFDLIGFGAQNDNSLPYTDSYYLIPRGVNDIIPQKIYSKYSIQELRSVNSSGIATNITQNVQVTGIVSSPNFASPNKLEFLLTDQDGAGITIYNFSNNFDYTVQERDVLTIVGTVKQLSGLTVIVADTLFKETIKSDYVDPTKITQLTEAQENTLAIWHKNLKLINPSEWTPSGPYFDVNITDGVDVIKMRIRAQTNLYQLPNPQFKSFKLTGQITQYSNKLPYLDNYLFQPRYQGDLDFSNVLEDVEMLDRQAYPNPMGEKLYLTDFHLQSQEVKLLDEFGHLLARPSAASPTIDTQLLPAGNYLLSVVRQGTTFVQKLVKY